MAGIDTQSKHEKEASGTTDSWLATTRSYMIHDDTQIKGFFGDVRWLSNFYESPVFYGGRWFPSVEAAYQSAKCVKASDVEAFVSMNPSQAKKAGQKVLKRSDWDEYKSVVMATCVLSKFMETQELKEKLLATGEKYLEETNHWNDKYWGVCSKTNIGKNMLGKTLMGTRSYLRTLYVET